MKHNPLSSPEINSPLTGRRALPLGGLAMLVFWGLLLFLTVVRAPMIEHYSGIRTSLLVLSCVLVMGFLSASIWWIRQLSVPYCSLARVLIAFVFLFAAFTYLGYVIDGINPHHHYWEARLAHLDYVLFGNYPAVYLEAVTTPLLTEYLQIIYATFYFLPLVLTLYLFRQQRYQVMRFCTLGVVLCFLLNYLGYLCVPATAVEFNPLIKFRAPLQWQWIGQWLNQTIKHGEGLTRDCFPSGHTAISVLLLYYGARYARVTLWFYVPVVLSMVFSTVYLRYHYLVDVIAGLLLTLFCIVAFPPLFRWWEQDPSFR